MRKIIIFDTTLRDGEQSPGASMNIAEKLQVAKALEDLGVDVIEAGFPISSQGDFDAVKSVARMIKRSSVCGLSRCTQKDIEAAACAVKPAKHPRIHVFLATSKIHMQYKLKKAEDEILRLAQWGVKYAKKFVKDVEFSPEDASRTEPEFLFKVIEAVIDAGATTVNIPDTVGYAIPIEYGSLIRAIKENVPNIDRAKISVHCHDDLGLSVSNSLAAVINGADQVECTINGIGERAGNASLEEIVMAINTRRDLFKAYTDIKKESLYKTSKLVSQLTGITVAPNKAIVGLNAFAHESGIHQDGVLKKRATYEIIRPQDVGFAESKIVLGKHSGRHALADRLKKLGFALSEKQIGETFIKFKNLADIKKEIFDEDLIALVQGDILRVPEKYQLLWFHIESATDIKPKANIKLKVNNKTLSGQGTGDGPVDACYKTIEKLVNIKSKLLDYSIKSITGGKDAMGEVTVKVQANKNVAIGTGSSTDIIDASVKAYINAINKLAYPAKYLKYHL